MEDRIGKRYVSIMYNMMRIGRAMIEAIGWLWHGYYIPIGTQGMTRDYAIWLLEAELMTYIGYLYNAVGHNTVGNLEEAHS